jgi:OOP family OmpA-OmpF porin
MKTIQTLLIALIAIGLSACTVKNAPSPGACAIAGAAIGGAGTAGIYSDQEDDKDSEDVAAAAGIGAVAGALLGYGVCMLIEEEEAPPPPPEPEPLPEILSDIGDPCEGIIQVRTIRFDFDSAEIRTDAMPVLDALATALRRCPQRLIRVEAHTDSIGSEQYNLALSDRRAASVYTYLTEHGVPTSMLESKGYGESEPVASNDTEEGRAMNRRVELEPIR